MRILIFHPVHLPPKDYGGTERVVLWLARALKDLGHVVTVVCLEGSQLPEGVHAEFVAEDARDECDFFKSKPKNWFKENFDLIHFMAPPSPKFLKEYPVPYLVTVHGNGKKDEIFPKNTVFLSENHATRHGRKSFIYNGIDPNETLFKSEKENHYLFLSKTSWSVKNLKGAIEIAERSKVNLQITGGNRPYSLRLKAAFSKNLNWVGPVNGNDKAERLSRAKGLLFPVLWDEPFGLVVIEALISGTPVFGPKRGSLTELVPTDCGFLYPVNSTVDEQVNYFKDFFMKKESGEFLDGTLSSTHAQNRLQLQSKRCHEWVMEKFTHHHMAKNYLKVYEKILNGEEI